MYVVKMKVYEFVELSEEAKEKAREWYRDGALYYNWWDCTFDDAERVGLKIGDFELYRHTIDLKLTTDGVDVAKDILNEHGEGCTTHVAAREFIANAAYLRMAHGRDYRERVEYEDICTGFGRALGECYLTMLDSEYEYLVSDECVDETIISNEYTFTESGRRFG